MTFISGRFKIKLNFKSMEEENLKIIIKVYLNDKLYERSENYSIESAFESLGKIERHLEKDENKNLQANIRDR